MKSIAGAVLAVVLLAGSAGVARANDAAAQGCLDLADGITFAGWAADADFAGPVWVHFYIDGAFAGATLADKTRADVGAHAFSWQAGTTFAAGSHTVHAYAIGVDASGLVSGSNPELVSSPRTFVVQGAANAHAATGNVDLLDDTWIAGWARDDDVAGPIAVHFYVDGRFVGAQLADKMRADVGAHAFMWQHPAFGPGPHTVIAYAIGVDARNVPTGENPPLPGARALTQPRLWPLRSSDGRITVVFDSLWGGAVTEVTDSANFPGRNLVDSDQAGACFQPAFWVLPLPENPTLAGFLQYGLAGNPIGIWGTNEGVFDDQEFIRRESDTLHFKSRFIRYDYSLPGQNVLADMAHKDQWDTPWYLEQWASFDATYAHTLVLRSKITYVGAAPKQMNTRQLPIIFSTVLSRVGFWKGGKKVVEDMSSPRSFNPDSNWAAFLAPNVDAGIGTLLPKSARSQNPAFELFAAQGPGVTYPGAGPPVYAFFPGALPDLDSMGPTHDAAPLGTDVYLFQPGGSCEWTTWHPVGSLDSIKKVADSIAR